MTRVPKTYTHDGKTQTVADWACDTGLHPQVIRNRIRYGWPIERVLSEPQDPRVRYRERISADQVIRFRGKAFTVSRWAKLTGIPTRIIRNRLHARWTITRALTEPPKSKKASA
jgi:hypothetical protein